MSFPKTEKPTHELVVPSTQETITYRPYKVSEEKILLMALQGEDLKEIERAVKQILSNCILTPNFDVSKLKIFDVEFIFLQLRIKSQGESVELLFEPIPGTECEECKKKRKIVANLTEAAIEFNEEHKEKIEFNEESGVVLKCPTIDALATFEKAKVSEDINDLFKAIWSCVDFIYDSEGTYASSSGTDKEGIEWLEDLDVSDFRKIEEFFKTLPRLKQSVDIKCKSCDFQTEYTMVGLESFFV